MLRRSRLLDVLREVAAGKSNMEIAAALSISGRTVDRHIANLYMKIDAHNKADAAYAFRNGLTRQVAGMRGGGCH
jgi:DNA-binding CsgD family transcriptional regulator